MGWIRIVLATAVASAAGFGIHVLCGQGWALEYATRAAQAGRLGGVLREPYPTYVVVVAALTTLIPTLGKVLVFLLVRDRLPGRTALMKGLAFGLLLLLINDALLRLPIMNVVIGNPVDVMLVQSLEAWLISPIMGILIALIVPAPPHSRSSGLGGIKAPELTDHQIAAQP